MSLKLFTFSTIMALAVSGAALAQKNPTVTFLNPPESNKAYPFSEAVQVGGMLMLSGQIGTSSETNQLVKGGFAAEAKQTLKNIKDTLERYNYQMSDVVKCTVILTDINNFPELNKIYSKAFSFPYPTRTTYAVDALAINAQIEIECMAAK